MTDWYRDIGIDVKLSVESWNNVSDHLYNYVDGVFTPDYDLVITYWGGDYDPALLLSTYASAQIENWSDTNWSNAKYDELYSEQDATSDPEQRLDMIYRMQEAVYESAQRWSSPTRRTSRSTILMSGRAGCRCPATPARSRMTGVSVLCIPGSASPQPRQLGPTARSSGRDCRDRHRGGSRRNRPAPPPRLSPRGGLSAGMAARALRQAATPGLMSWAAVTVRRRHCAPAA